MIDDTSLANNSNDKIEVKRDVMVSDDEVCAHLE